MTPVASAGRSMRKAFGHALRELRKHPALAALLIVTTLTQGLFQGLIVWVLREVLRLFSAAQGASILGLTIGGLAVFGIWALRALSTFGGEVASVRLAQGVEFELMQQVLGKFLRMSVRRIDRSSLGDWVMTAFHDLLGVRNLTLNLGTILSSFSRLLGLAVVAWLLSPKLSIIGLFMVPIALYPAFKLGRKITYSALHARSESVSVNDIFLQAATGLKVIRVNRAEARVLDLGSRSGRERRRYMIGEVQAKSLARLLLEVVSGLGLISVLIIGGQDVAAGALDWQSLLAILIAVMAIYVPVVNLLTVYNGIRGYIPNLDRIQDIVDTPPELEDAPDAKPLACAPKTIELKNVSFAYHDSPVLESISAVFNRGETIGIVGASGAGKSTLISLMLRLYDPTDGQILFDGVDLRNIRHRDLMDQYSIVLQEPFLFIDTAANNIRFTKPDATTEDVIEAAKAANIHEEILRMEDGYETILGQRVDARGVSVGQKQRIAIAGALLKNAPILFLDEATSNLDSVSERVVQAAVDRLMQGRTTFMIAHRLSSLRAVDRILVLDHGKLVGLGPHDDLLKTCPTYQRLWTHQSIEALAQEDNGEDAQSVVGL